jgi:hypothetical protein
MHHGIVLRRHVRVMRRPRSQFHSHLLSKCRSPVFVLLLFSLIACDPGGTPGDAASTFRSMWSELYPATLQIEYSTDTLEGAFRFAAAAQTPLEAKNRWSRFLAEWDPPNGEFEDAMHANLVAWAKLERRRVEVLVGDSAELQLINQQLRALVAQLE